MSIRINQQSIIVDNVSDLSNLNYDKLEDYYIEVLGYYNRGDGGGQNLYYDPDNSSYR